MGDNDMQDWTPAHRHYKGGLYRVLHTALHSETEEKLVIYQSADGRIWARPFDMFHSPGPDGRGKRFAPMEGDQPVQRNPVTPTAPPPTLREHHSGR